MADSSNAPLSRADVVNEVSAQVNLPASQVETVIRAFEASLIRNVASGTEIRMLGLGTFKQSQRAARAGRNPATGEAIKIKASKGVSFKAGKAFKDAINSGGKKAKGAAGGAKAAPAKTAPAAKAAPTKAAAKVAPVKAAPVTISKSMAGKVLATDSKGGAKAAGGKGGKKK